MKRFSLLLFVTVLSFVFLNFSSISEAGGGHRGGSGHSGGSHGGYYGGYHGGYYGRYHGGHHGGYYYYGGPVLGFGAGLWAGYYPWYYTPYYGAYTYPYYYPAYPYYPPPTAYDPSSAVAASPDTYVVPLATASEVPPNPNQRRCQIWAPTGEFHEESRWNPQTRTMETVSVPNFAWQDYPCK